MARFRASVRILPQEYGAFVMTIKSGPRLPASYDDWVKRCREEDARCIARGDIVKEVLVNFDEFASYCTTAGVEPSYDVLTVIALPKAIIQR